MLQLKQGEILHRTKTMCQFVYIYHWIRQLQIFSKFLDPIAFKAMEVCPSVRWIRAQLGTSSSTPFLDFNTTPPTASSRFCVSITPYPQPQPLSAYKQVWTHPTCSYNEKPKPYEQYLSLTMTSPKVYQYSSLLVLSLPL